MQERHLVQIFTDAKGCKCVESEVDSSTNSASGTSNHPSAHTYMSITNQFDIYKQCRTVVRDFM